MKDLLDSPLKPKKEVSITQQSILAGVIGIFCMIISFIADLGFGIVIIDINPFSEILLYVAIGEVVSRIIIHQWKRT